MSLWIGKKLNNSIQVIGMHGFVAEGNGQGSGICISSCGFLMIFISKNSISERKECWLHHEIVLLSPLSLLLLLSLFVCLIIALKWLFGTSRAWEYLTEVSCQDTQYLWEKRIRICNIGGLLKKEFSCRTQEATLKTISYRANKFKSKSWQVYSKDPTWYCHSYTFKSLPSLS